MSFDGAIQTTADVSRNLRATRSTVTGWDDAQRREFDEDIVDPAVEIVSELVSELSSIASNISRALAMIANS